MDLVVVASAAVVMVVAVVVVARMPENRTRDPQVNETLHYLPPIPLEREDCHRGSDHTGGPHSTG